MADGDNGGSQGDVSRRAFLVRMAAIAFAVPVVSSFTIDAVAHATGEQPRQVFANQIFGNQVAPNQFFGNQRIPSNFFPNQTFACQYFPNQLPS